MLSRNEVKYIQSLSHKKQRQQAGEFIAEGPKIFAELLRSGYIISKLYHLESFDLHVAHREIETRLITEEELGRISQLETPNQVLAVVRMKTEIQVPVTEGWMLALDGIQDPGNLGTIIRIADWFGIHTILCSADTVELYNPKVIQSTMGSFVRTQLVYGDLSTLLRQYALPVWGAVLNGSDIRSVQLPRKGILLIGNESQGIRDHLSPFITHPVTIPRKGGAESLNAAVATGILLFHLQS